MSHLICHTETLLLPSLWHKISMRQLDNCNNLQPGCKMASKIAKNRNSILFILLMSSHAHPGRFSAKPGVSIDKLTRKAYIRGSCSGECRQGLLPATAEGASPKKLSGKRTDQEAALFINRSTLESGLFKPTEGAHGMQFSVIFQVPRTEGEAPEP
jgi:hypothetical protein